MLKKVLLGLMITLLMTVSFSNFLFADILPAPPTLRLTVEKSPLAIYPPIMIYTAQLSYVPPVYSGLIMIDFYNAKTDSSNTQWVLIGSVKIDSTGKAVLSKQMPAGSYKAQAKTTINNQVIASNIVFYNVP